MPRNATFADLDAYLIARVRTDAAFRDALLTDADAALAREAGAPFPAGIELVVVQESAGVHYVVLPPVGDRELSDHELDAVSGGQGAQIAAQAYNMLMTCLKFIVDSRSDTQKDVAQNIR